MAGFAVDTGAVRELGAQWARLASELSATTPAAALTAAEAGSPHVSGALDEFLAHWRGQSSTLVANLEALARAFDDAATSYDGTDSGVASSADGS